MPRRISRLSRTCHLALLVCVVGILAGADQAASSQLSPDVLPAYTQATDELLISAEEYIALVFATDSAPEYERVLALRLRGAAYAAAMAHLGVRFVPAQAATFDCPSLDDAALEAVRAHSTKGLEYQKNVDFGAEQTAGRLRADLRFIRRFEIPDERRVALDRFHEAGLKALEFLPKEATP